jgi:uncharacterized protein YndB with AHSA1/START domain
MEIAADAPAVARAEVEVAATPEVVWDVLADVAAWPSWNPDVRSALLEGPLAAGTRFRWKAGPGTITSTLQQVEQPHLIAWTGKTLGISAVHVYRLRGQGDTTVVRSEESWDGALVRLVRRRMSRSLQRAIESGLEHLKREAERRASSGPSA